ncbi:MAG: hypothetical protein K2M76_01410 [Muribaculaceae bacterium]|nr:hypothetical protein [Muribaculaceae bacterium]
MRKQLQTVCVLLLLTACTIATIGSDEAVADAMELGRMQAAELCALADEDADLCPVLLDIKAKESEMRMYGLDQAADSFLSCVEKYVVANNPSLAEEIFGE